MSSISQQAVSPTPISAATTTLIYTGSGVTLGFFVVSGTSPTITIYDGITATGTPILATFTPASNGWYSFPAAFSKGLLVVTGGTTPNVTVVWALN